MVKLFKYLLFLMTLIIMMMIGGAWFLSQKYGDEIKQRLLDELNANILTEVSIDGPVELSFIKHFPKMSVVVHDIEMKESIQGSDKPLLAARQLYLIVNLWDIIQHNWTVESIDIEHGQLSLHRLQDGTINYKIVEERSDSITSKPVSFLISINKATLTEVNFKYLDDMSDVAIDLNIDDAILKGNFSPQNLAIQTSASVFSNSIRIKKIDYANNKNLYLDGGIEISPEENKYTLAIPEFLVEQNKFKVAGNFVIEDKNPVFDLDITGQNIAIKDIPKLLPETYLEKINNFSGSGKLQISTSIKGKLDRTNDPDVTASYEVTDATLKHDRLINDIKYISFKGTFDNGNQQSLETSTLSVSSFSINAGNPITGAIDLYNLRNPSLNANATGTLNLNWLNPFFTENIKGEIIADNVRYQGNVKMMTSAKKQPLKLSGSFEFKDVSVEMENKFLAIPEGKVIILNNKLTADAVHFTSSNSDLFIYGSLENFNAIQQAFDGIKGSPVIADMTIKAQSIDINDFSFSNNNTNVRNASPAPSKQYHLNLKGKVKISSQVLKHKKLEAYDVTGLLAFSPNKIALNDFSCNVMDGIFDASSTITLKGNEIHATTLAQGMDIDIQELFYQMEDFGQTTLTSKNLKGKLTIGVDVTTVVKNAAIDTDQLYAQADITLTNGQLIDFKPLEKLSKFIDIEELQNVKFSTLKNQIHINKRSIYIPEMIVQSNALNLSVTGMQTFDDLIDYKIKVNIFDILARKIRRRSGPANYETVDENNFNFFLSMTGSLQNPTIKYDRQGIRERIAQQKEEIKKIKSNDNYGQREEARDWEVEDDLEYIEWDEDQP